MLDYLDKPEVKAFCFFENLSSVNFQNINL